MPTAKPKTEADYRRDARNVKQHLEELSAAVSAHLKALDAEMALPSTPERDKRIAALANDRVRYFALGVDYRKDKKR
jgi:hypothetical protein